MLWSNIDKPSDYNQIKNGQLYNHLNGSNNITSKDKLHDILSVYGRSFYPKSFLIPNEYDNFQRENNVIALKVMLQ